MTPWSSVNSSKQWKLPIKSTASISAIFGISPFLSQFFNNNSTVGKIFHQKLSKIYVKRSKGSLYSKTSKYLSIGKETKFLFFELFQPLGVYQQNHNWSRIDNPWKNFQTDDGFKESRPWFFTVTLISLHFIIILDVKRVWQMTTW